MKYNVKQAVSGLQGNLDQANQNALVNRGLGNLFKGIADRTNVGIKQGQTAQVQAALANYQTYYDAMLNDPKADPLKKQLAGDKLQQLKLLSGITNIGNIDQFPSLYSSFMGKDTVSGMDLDLRKLENALKIANIGANSRVAAAGIYGDNARTKNEIAAEQNAQLGAIIEGLKPKPLGGNPLGAIYGNEPTFF
jgi:hypothetical protein